MRRGFKLFMWCSQYSFQKMKYISGLSFHTLFFENWRKVERIEISESWEFYKVFNMLSKLVVEKSKWQIAKHIKNYARNYI